MDYKCGFTHCDFSDEYQESQWKTESESPGITVRTSPVIESTFPARECICSWNIISGFNGWSEIFLRANIDGEWTNWYRMGVWASSDSYVSRFSIKGQDDNKGSVSTDTLILKKDAASFQIKIRLCEIQTGGMPLLKRASLSWSSLKPPSLSNIKSPSLKKIELKDVPSHSQMEYKDGGNSWCSPTSLSMVIEYWRKTGADRETLVREAVSGTYDPVYKGNGNWSFNAAWAGSLGFNAYVKRFNSLKELEPLLEAGIPLVLSISWNNDMGRPLDNSPVKSSSGHLTLLKGFDGRGNALMNEPASPSNETVQRKYSCDQLQARWLEASGGVCFMVYPQNKKIDLDSNPEESTIILTRHS